MSSLSGKVNCTDKDHFSASILDLKQVPNKCEKKHTSYDYVMIRSGHYLCIFMHLSLRVSVFILFRFQNVSKDLSVVQGLIILFYLFY